MCRKPKALISEKKMKIVVERIISINILKQKVAYDQGRPKGN